MQIPEAMLTLEGRLNSFTVARPLPKRRGSSTKTQKTVTWPHAKPSPEDLAKAGFFYTPVGSSPDNVTCFMCEKCLDGWEEEDSPALEHLHHSPDCAWATIACVESADKLEDYEREHPMGDNMTEARRATFADHWPHESKKGWTCKTEKMVEGGWYYCPTMASDDFVACPYCALALDGWEPKDKPLDEHRRRSPNCPFIELCSTQKRTIKRARISKASRASALSAIIVASESPAHEELAEQDKEDSAVTTATDMSAKPKTGKKGPKAKKATSKVNGKKPKSKLAEDVDMDLVEPEDSGFEVKVTPPAKATRGRKRKSEVLDDNVIGRGGLEEPVPQAPSPKRRATRTRSSVAEQTNTMELSAEKVEDQVVDLTTPEAANTKAARKGRGSVGRKPRTSSRRPSKRKASVTSTASKASLRAQVPDDETIEKALEADLDRSLVGAISDHVEVAPIEPDRLSKEAEPAVEESTASVAPVRRSLRSHTARMSAQTEGQTQSVIAAPEPPRSSLEMPPALVSGPSLASSQPKTKATKGRPGRKPSAKQEVVVQKRTRIETEVVAQIVQTTTPSPSPQSSDAENHPPSSRRTIMSSVRSNRLFHGPGVPLQARTPMAMSLSKKNIINGKRLQTDMPWSAVDLETVFATMTPLAGTGAGLGESHGLDKENNYDNNNNSNDENVLMTMPMNEAMERVKANLTSPEKRLGIEQWLRHNAKLGEERLRRECDRKVCIFEREGNKALQALEGIMAAD